MAPSTRPVILVALIVIGTIAAVLSTRRSTVDDDAQLAWTATAQQFGPVGYRDPAGAISPDGRSIAYSEGRFLRVRPIDGGPIVDLPAGPGQIRYLTWRPDSRAVAADGDPAGGHVLYDMAARTRTPLVAAGPPLRQPVWSPDGKRLAALVNAREGNELWIFPADSGTAPISGSRGERVRALAGAASFPAWTPGGDVACLMTTGGRPRVTLPCGGAVLRTNPDLDAYGPIAFSRDGAAVYVALANSRGTVDLWRAAVAGGRARRLTSFARDTYGPSVAADGTVVVKTQTYRTSVAVVPAGGGAAAALTTFQSETPSLGSDRPLDRDYLRHLAPAAGRCEVSGHRAGRGHHR